MRFGNARLIVLRCATQREVAEIQEDLEAKGYRARPWRRGTLLTRVNLGRPMIHAFLALSTYGLGNLVYAAKASRGRQSHRVYVGCVGPEAA